MKKLTSLMLSLALLLMTLPLTVAAAQSELASDNMVEINLVVSDDTTITVNIPSEYQSLMSEQDMLDIAIRDGVQDGETITFYEVGEAKVEDSSPISPVLFETYKTYVTLTGSEWAAQNYFVISAAKGQTTKLTTKFTQTVSAGVSAGTPWNITPELKVSVTAEHTTEQQFVGPPEGGAYNTREFRVQFYAKKTSWKQEKYDMYGNYLGSRSGTGTQPTRWASYSIDRNL